MSTGNENYNLRYPKGFKAYPHNQYKLEGYGTPRGYVTLAGVALTLTVSALYFSYAQTQRREYPTHTPEWKAATAAYGKSINQDPIHK
ncbi:hypothetical protein DICPUDRAFT_156777 [Dictyostelium purpureum]|uniref:Uncharacterized protein n=1 Tax=Dictyostelium purpureum TaxID=5786 RepID=F0ZXE9_DICPU|nr:uncharacterized protein DICPUDRAFT_156777 [Dictyostelium purpureum]EGC31371.1 hypothetical protein DICPUDRAFT_156777 [Dictyostelium purpureum]|eukprot:XP_003292092.1 hypothetical protein DICPUDRAFT_156777 [Dictyostelium purpureum]